MSKLILAIDQGTTGTRTYLFDPTGKVVGSAYQEFTQYFPKPGWVEHDALEIWDSVETTGRKALKSAGVKPSRIAGIGITNQRETVVLWDRKTGKPIHKAIVWQCRRTAHRCDQLKAQGRAGLFQKKTGLVLDAYFSGTKVEWLLQNVPGAAKRAAKGELAFGTIDSWLLWKLTGGHSHATDFTNASRTLLFNIRTKQWDDQLLKLLHVPRAILPKVHPSAGRFGETSKKSYLGGGIEISGIAGDQQAALFGQGCHTPGTLKNTYGTGCFLVLNLGKQFLLSKNKLLTTLACDPHGQPCYALEGAVFIGGAAIQWLRDGLQVIKTSPESEVLARKVPDTGGVYLVPAFVGLGAPYWDPHARGALIGITRGTKREHVVRAGLESLAYQTKDLVDAMVRDSKMRLRELRVDGGACKNDLLMQFQADILNVRIDRPKMVETTALGAAALAGLGVDLWGPGARVPHIRKTDKRFTPKMKGSKRERLWAGWKDAVGRVLTRG
ncbi:MAG TPA: glycerol kinase GlpK [bacterium]|nr:glycerol kinase GlpK [bacterium]